jgi:hypothetical protein
MLLPQGKIFQLKDTKIFPEKYSPQKIGLASLYHNPTNFHDKPEKGKFVKKSKTL